MLADLCVRGVHHHRLDRAHRRGAVPHVERGRRAAPHDRRAGLRELVEDHAGQAFGGVLDDHLAQGHGRGCAAERHRDQFGRDAGVGAVEQGLAGEVAPLQWWARAAVEDRKRSLSQGPHASPNCDEHRLHDLEGVLLEGAGDHRLRGVD